MHDAFPDPGASRFSAFGETIFAEMTALAKEAGAVNLSQGFPDFDGPEIVKDAAREAIASGRNQYARMSGEPELNRAIADRWRSDAEIEVDPETEITVTAGCTEALAATALALLNPGDEVVVFEPFYDSYRAVLAMTGARPRFVTLRPPSARAGSITGEPFSFDPGELEAAFSERTRAVLLNTPHNPTGKVFTRDELAIIAGLCRRHDAMAITDEVYERLVYEGVEHVSLATLPGMAERTVVCSSLGKTFSLTGWKIGWAIAPPAMTRAIRRAHQYLIFAVATPFQHAAVVALREGEGAVRSLRADYERRRDTLADALAAVGLGVFKPRGAYFLLADHTPLGFADDVECCRTLTTEAKVAAIPPSAFYAEPERGRSLVRFAFCKRDETLAEAIRRLEAYALSRSGAAG